MLYCRRPYYYHVYIIIIITANILLLLLLHLFTVIPTAVIVQIHMINETTRNNRTLININDNNKKEYTLNGEYN